MAIVVQPTGMVKTLAALGQLAAQARANEEAAQRAERVADRATRVQAQLLAQQHQREMLLYKTQLDSEAQIEAERRARAWEIEKMEMASRLDFQRQEARRQRYEAEKEAKLEALDRAHKRGLISSEEYNQAVLQTMTEIPFYTQAQIAQRKPTDPLREQLAAMLAGSPVEGQPSVSASGKRARVRAPDGTIGTIDMNEWPEAQRQGFTLISVLEDETPVDKEGMKDKQKYLQYFYNSKYVGKVPLSYAQWIAAGRPQQKVITPLVWREDYKKMSEAERAAIGW